MNFPKCKHDIETLQRLQAMPLRKKIFETRLRIAEWVKTWGEDKVYVSFSGGKDSTVLLDLVRSDYPNTPAVFFDTGLEFPEIREFVKTIDNVTWTRPKMTFKKVLEHHGYPAISKRQAQYIDEYQSAKSESIKTLRLWGIRKDGTTSEMSAISQKWHYLAKQSEIQFSHKCCKELKIKPAEEYGQETDRKPFVGLMAGEGFNRTKSYEKLGCNAYEIGNPMSRPIIFWTEEDIWEYIRTKQIPYSPIYDMGYTRTGCMFCMFGVHLEQSPNRFQRMEITHPKQWDYCINKLGLAEVLDLIGVQYKYQGDLFDNDAEFSPVKICTKPTKPSNKTNL